jgi:hypothetical protein
MKIFYLAVTLVAIAAGGKGVFAHEFWIDPVAYQLAHGQTAEAHLRVGEAFRGAPQPYLTHAFSRFDVVSQDRARPVAARLGDIPAFRMADLPEGLAVIVHETTGQDLIWADWEKFESFALHKDLGDVAAMQAARGLDQEDVAEVFFRHAKSLIAVGAGAGHDARLGLRTEFVALTNPYVDDLADGFAVQLWLDATPRADVQVEMFEKALDGTVTVTLHRTDDQGIAVLPVTAGQRYMIDAVVLEPLTPQAQGDAEWRTLWANMTFAVPG